MEISRSGSSTVYFTVGALLSWITIFLQLYLIIVNRTADVPETIIRFFSFFTVLTNILVAVCFTSAMTLRQNQVRFFSSAYVHSAVGVYIVVVGLVYNLVLRQLWAPTGLQKIIDEFLHSVIPVVFLLHWFLFVHKVTLKWHYAILWLVYPFAYVIFILIRGRFSNFYPYPFVDVKNLGYNQVLINSLYLLVGFLILSVLLIAIGKTQKAERIV
ncbi:MAG: Pr6Pr family membrane protein [Flavobacterium sp.]|nr:Pr6Pr family membrane protein [Pedobacter sp.]